MSQSSLQLFQQLPPAGQDCQELGEESALQLLASLTDSGVRGFTSRDGFCLLVWAVVDQTIFISDLDPAFWNVPDPVLFIET